MDIIRESILKGMIGALLLLFIGVLIGLQADDARTDYLEEQLQESNMRVETFLVTQSYLEDSSVNYCKVAEERIPYLSKKNTQIGNDLRSFSGKSLGDSGYDQLRNRYYVNQLKLYNMLYSYKTNCNSSEPDLIFYFFDDSVESQRQGSVLTEYWREVDNTTNIFSFNIDTADDSRVVATLRTDYNVTETPTLIVNGEKIDKGFVPLHQLKDMMRDNRTG